MHRFTLSIFIVLLLHCLALPALPLPQQNNASIPVPLGVEKDGVAVSVSLKQPSIPADEQPQIVVRFQNTTSDYINLYDVEAVWDWRIRFTSTDRRAKLPGPWRLRMDSIPNRYPITHKQIKGGESLTVSVNLNDPPFTFDYVYEGPHTGPLTPIRQLSRGTYRMSIDIALRNPIGQPGYHFWTGPVTTQSIEYSVRGLDNHGPVAKPTSREMAAYDHAIDQVTRGLQPGGLWLNGVAPDINLPSDARAEEVIASSVNQYLLESKAYRILRVRRLDLSGVNASAALVKVGAKLKVLIFFPSAGTHWWTRFYDAE